MEIMYDCCCGLDVHKQLVVGCVVSVTPSGERQKETRSFTTMTAGILALADWLTAAGCTQVAMESTGVYWKPIWNLLEGQFEVLLVNAQHIKAVRRSAPARTVASQFRPATPPTGVARTHPLPHDAAG
jgi:transposase